MVEKIDKLPNFSPVIKQYIQNVIDSDIPNYLKKDFTSLEFLDKIDS